MHLRPIRLLTVLVLLLFSAVPSRATGLVDPLLRFRQMRTEHFIVYFHVGEEALAARLVSLVEEVRTQVGRALSVAPPGLTHVVIADQSEIANGWATPLPRDIVFLNAAVPSGADMIGNTDDWLRLVFTHEYTHIVHLDRSGSWAWLVRGVFGRTPIAFPNLYLPQWQIEGLATWQESAATGAGRMHAGDFRAIELVAAAGGRSLTLDRASGGLVRWPGGHAAYSSGLGFHEYLAQRFGPETLGTLATRTARRLPFLGTRAFNTVYGEPLGSLWREYTTQIAAGAATLRTGPQDARRLTAHGYVTTAPRIAQPMCDACAPTVIYSLQGPHDFPSLRAIGLDGTGDRQLTTRYLGSTAGTSPTQIVFDQQELRRNVGLYSDLYEVDRASGAVHQVTRDARLQDPDLAADGVTVVAVRERSGRRELVVLSLAKPAGRGPRAANVRVVASAPDTQFSTPRWSPDGRHIVAERRRLGALPEIVVLSESGAIERTISRRGSRLVTPTWRPDAKAIVAAADVNGRTFELYEFPLDEDAAARRLTHSAGAIWPDVSADGGTLVFAGYTPDGYDIFAVPYAPVGEERLVFDRDSMLLQPPAAAADGAAPAVRDYSPAATLPPTSWTPLATVSADQTRVGAAIAGSDLLGRHAYAIGATWLARGVDVPRALPSRVPDWNAAYVYSRWRPSVFGSIARDTLFRDATDAAAHQYKVGVIQHEYQVGVFVPISHVRTSVQALGSVVRTDTNYLLPERDRRVALVSSRLGAAYDSSRTYGYSISAEDGVAAGFTVEMARRALGSSADATTATADVRAYLPGAAPQHVIALRAAGGLSYGDDLARQAFVVGGVAASPGVMDFSADAIGLLRTRFADVAGTRVVVANGEYRMPLANIERGLGTWPLFLRTLHASLFVDAAQVRGIAPHASGWRRALGGELGVTGVAGYALPLDAVVGVAWGDGGHGRAGSAVYGRLGHAF